MLENLFFSSTIFIQRIAFIWAFGMAWVADGTYCWLTSICNPATFRAVAFLVLLQQIAVQTSGGRIEYGESLDCIRLRKSKTIKLKRTLSACDSIEELRGVFLFVHGKIILW